MKIKIEYYIKDNGIPVAWSNIIDWGDNELPVVGDDLDYELMDLCLFNPDDPETGVGDQRTVFLRVFGFADTSHRFMCCTLRVCDFEDFEEFKKLP